MSESVCFPIVEIYYKGICSAVDGHCMTYICVASYICVADSMPSCHDNVTKCIISIIVCTVSYV
jgi:hypothetical protein